MLICSPVSHSPPPRMGDLSTPASGGKEVDSDEASLELCRMLQLEEQEQLQDQLRQMVEAQSQAQPDDDETMALVRRMQQEDEDAFQEQLRETERLQDEQMRDAGLVIEGADGGSPSQFSYEQLTALGETVGNVSRGASDESIGALKTITFKCCDSSVNAGTKCSICQEDFEADDELRVLPCKHAEHAECLDQWLRVNKSCPHCKAEVPIAPGA